MPPTVSPASGDPTFDSAAEVAVVVVGLGPGVPKARDAGDGLETGLAVATAPGVGDELGTGVAAGPLLGLGVAVREGVAGSVGDEGCVA